MGVKLSADAVDPNIIRIAQFIGLLDNELGVRSAFLGNPLDEFKDSFLQHHDILLELLNDLFVSTDGQLQGIPGPDQGSTWYTIPGMDTDILYFTTNNYRSDVEEEHFVIGAGIKWGREEGSLNFDLWGNIPLIDINVTVGSIDMALGAENSPAQLAFKLTDDSGFGGDSGINFQGVKMSALIYTTNKKPDLSFKMLQLSINNADPEDMDLSQLADVDAEGWFNIIFSLISAKLAEAGAEMQRIGDHFFPILGLKGSGPLINWFDLPGQGTDIIKNWLKSLMENSTALNEWLQHWYELLGTGAGSVSGSGTRQDPKSISISASSGINLNLTVAYVQDAQGDYTFYPGIQLATDGVEIASGVKFNIQGVLELFAIPLGGSGSFTPIPKLDVHGRLYKDADYLIDTDFSSDASFSFFGDFKVKELRAGLALNGVNQIEPILELVDVRTDQGNWPVIDLSSGDEFIEGIADIANSIITQQLSNLLGAATDSSHPGKYIASLLGIIPPTSNDAPDPWPTALSVSAEKITQFLGNPLGAIGCYHARCIETEYNGAPLWRFLLDDLTALMRHQSVPVPAISGNGSEEDPWKVEIYSATEGKVYLQIFVQNDEPARCRLNASIVLAPETINLSADADLNIKIAINLLDIDMPCDDQCPGPVNAQWIGSVSVSTALTGKPKLEASTGTGIAFSLDSLELSFKWLQQGNDFNWSVNLNNFLASWTLDAAQSFSLPSISFGGGLDLNWDLSDLGGISLPDLSGLFKLCLGSWLVGRGGSFGFGLSGILGLFPSPNFQFPNLPGFPDLPDWNTGPFSFPIDWPSFEVPDWLAFFSNPWPGIWAHIKLLFSKPSWAFPTFRFLGGSLFGSLPDFSLPDLGWGSGGSISFPDMDSLPMEISGDGTWKNPWALKLKFDEIPPIELLFWLDPDGPPTGDRSNLIISLLPQEWSNIDNLIASETFSNADLAQLFVRLSELSPVLRRALAGIDGAKLGVHFTALLQRLRLSDGLVPFISQMPPEGTANWESAHTLETLPEAVHSSQLSESSVLTAIENKINELSGADTLPVLLIGSAWESTGVWSDLLARFGGADYTHFDFRETGVDPDQIGIGSAGNASSRFFVGDISVFNTAPSLDLSERFLPVEGADSAENSQAKQIVRMVERINAIHNKKVIIAAHSHSGLAALAAVQRENSLAQNDKMIGGLITIGTPLLNTPLVWAPEEVVITGDDVEELPGDLDIKDALSEASAFLDRIGIDQLLGSAAIKQGLQDLFNSLNNNLNLPDAVEGVFPEHAFDGIDNLDVSVPALAIATRLPTFEPKNILLNWLKNHITDLGPEDPEYTAPTHVGFGVRYSDELKQNDFFIKHQVRFDACRVSLTGDDTDTSAYISLPRFYAGAELCRENGWLLGNLGSNPRVRRANFGITADSQQFLPEVVLHDAYLDGTALAEAHLKEVLSEVSENCVDVQATIKSLLDALITETASAAAGFEAFRNICDLLISFDLVEKTGSEYSFKHDGWESLLDDAGNFLRSRLSILASGGPGLTALLDTLADNFNLDLRDFPCSLLSDTAGLTSTQKNALKEILAFTGLVLPASAGYSINFAGWLDLITNPYEYFQTFIRDFLKDSEKTGQLLLKIKNLLALDDITCPVQEIEYSSFLKGIFESRGVFETCINIPADKLGGGLALSFCIKLDLPDESIIVEVKGGPSAIDIKLAFGLQFDLNETGDTSSLDTQYKISLILSEGSLPYGYNDLQLYPALPDMLARIGELIPRFLLNSVFSTIVEKLAIDTNESIGELLVSLGLARQLHSGGRIQLRPVDGLIKNTKGWLLSEAALGTAGGGIDTGKISSVINQTADIFNLRDESENIRLPYGLTFACNGGSAAEFSFSTSTPLSIASNGSIGFDFALTLNQQCAVGVRGDMNIAFTLPDPVDGLDLWDQLSVQLSYEDAKFALDVGIDSITLHLLPFPGWANLVDLSDGGVRILNCAIDALLTSLESEGDASLTSFITDIRNLLTSFDLNTPAKIEAMTGNPLTWLETRLNASNATAFISSLSSLLSTPLPADISQTGDTLVYSKGDIKISFGRKDGNLGVWIELSEFALGPVEITLNTGLEMVSLSSTPSVALDLDITTADPVLELGSASIKPSISFKNSPALKLEIYPLGDIFSGHQLRLDLLPGVNFQCDAATLIQLVSDVLLPMALEVLLDSSTVTDFISNVSIGDILTDMEILTKDAGSFNFNFPYDDIDGKDFLYRLLWAVLNKLSGIDFFNNTIGIVEKNVSGGKKHFGLKICLDPVTITDDPEIVLHFGDEKPEWLERTGGPDLEKGGIYLYLPVVNTGENPDLSSIEIQPEIELINFGIDLTGKKDDPLIDTGGFRLGGFEARLYFGITFDEGGDVSLGASANVVQIGLPLGSSSGNPIAQNLLSDDAGAGGENSAVNPDFTIEFSYYENLDVRLLGRDANEAEIWFPIERTFGPIHIGQVGVKWFNTDKAVALLIDGGVTLAGLNVFVDDLSVKIPIKTADDFTTWRLGLRGLGISYNGGGVKIAGALLRDNEAGTSYSGACLVEVGGKTFTAIGSYAKDEFTSMFVFVLLPIPLGGPPYFFIKGLAGGFGYNRGLNVPPVESVPSFPLIEAARGSDSFTNNPLSALQELGSAVPIKRGSYWVAGGIRFTSFELAQSVALAYILLDSGLEVGLLGLTRMELPEGKPLVNLEMALKARFSTSDGILSVEARLSDNSWLLSRDCRLTGGFAFYIWFSGSHQGDFVITIGGYHPRFVKPAHYPDVPRLGFNWRVSSKITIKGESYFALTPSAVMAGCLLEAAYKSGNLKAWFKAWAHFLIAWEPFAYDIEIGISIGVSYRLKINLLFGSITKTFKVELGAEVRIWGPKFSGKAKITWWVISFTIYFGAGDSKTAKKAISWDKFSEGFLPDDTKLFAADVVTGMITQEKDSNDTEQISPWIVQPEFHFRTETSIASNKLNLFGEDYASGSVDIRPMHRSNLDSTHLIKMVDKDGITVFKNESSLFENNRYKFLTNNDGFIYAKIITGEAPAALWEFDGGEEKPDAKTITTITGIDIFAEIDENRVDIDKTGEINVLDIIERGQHPLPFTQEISERNTVSVFSENAVLSLPDPDDPRSIFVAASMLLGTAWAERRNNIFNLLESLGADIERGETMRPTPEILSGYCTAPPKIVSLYEGMANQPDYETELDDSPTVVVVGPIMHARIPKLTAVLMQRAEPVRNSRRQGKTTINSVPGASRFPRVKVNSRIAENVPGAALRRVNPPTAGRQTLAPSKGSEFIVSAHAPVKAQKQFQAIEERGIRFTDSLERDATREISSLPKTEFFNTVQAGTTQVWDIPYKNAVGKMPVVKFSGSQAIRITAMDKSGALLNEREFMDQNGQWQLPPLTARVAITGLGKLSNEITGEMSNNNGQGKMGIVSLKESSNGFAVSGWQAHSQLIQVSGLTLLARGAVIRMGALLDTRRRGRIVRQALVNASDLLKNFTTIETFLPKDIEVVAIHVKIDDHAKLRELTEGLSVSSKEFILSESPVCIVDKKSAILLYCVKGLYNENGKTVKSFGGIGTVTQPGWSVTGVVGMQGDCDGWARRFTDAGGRGAIVENGPLTPTGVSAVQFIVEHIDNNNNITGRIR